MEDSPFRVIGVKGRLVDRVVEELQRLIIEGHLETGMRLPPERELAAQIGVSRTVVREAVQILTTKGLLETTHGVGTIVRDVTLDNISESLNWLLRTNGVSLDDLHQVRSILEVENIRQAVLLATDEDVADLRRILDEMRTATTNAELFALKDAEFHAALARISQNPLLMILLDSISDLIHEVRINVSQYPDLFATVIPDHDALVDLVAARDVQAACRTMQIHLDHARLIQELFLADKKLSTSEKIDIVTGVVTNGA
jgi:GntR family transcriptional repressor for pyruvate dehydrogenase complex